MKLIGDRIKEIRMHYGMTQTELADKLNLSKSIISAYENNIRGISIDVLLKLSELFNVSVSYFLEEADDSTQRLTVDITDLTKEQTKIILLLLEVFRKQNKKEDK